MVETWCVNDNHAVPWLIRMWIYDMLDLVRLRGEIVSYYAGGVVLPKQSINELQLRNQWVTTLIMGK